MENGENNVVLKVIGAIFEQERFCRSIAGFVMVAFEQVAIPPNYWTTETENENGEICSIFSCIELY